MDDANPDDATGFDRALIAALFRDAAGAGWRGASLVRAARAAGLDLGRVRARFPHKTAALLRSGSLMDQAVLSAAPTTGTPRDKLFDLVMARFDALQADRAGVLALLRALRSDPALAMLLGAATLRSMGWLLDAAGVPAGGVAGALRTKGLAAIWLYALRAWQTDDSPDLSATMAAVDRGLDRAVQAEDMLPVRRPMDAVIDPEPPVPDGSGASALPPFDPGAEGGSPVL